MKKDNEQLLKVIRNARAELMLNEVLYKYSSSILYEMESNPNYLPELLEYFELNQDEFLKKINSCKENITFYDEALCKMRKRNINK